MKLSQGKKLLLLGIALVVIDQVIKVLVKTNMTLGEHLSVFGSWFQILFVENKGMAFGMSFGGVVGKYALTFFRICLFGVLCWWIGRLLKREKKVPAGVVVGLTLIAAGAMGNIIDCLFYGLVFSESTPTAVASLGHYGSHPGLLRPLHAGQGGGYALLSPLDLAGLGSPSGRRHLLRAGFQFRRQLCHCRSHLSHPLSMEVLFQRIRKSPAGRRDFS